MKEISFLQGLLVDDLDESYLKQVFDHDDLENMSQYFHFLSENNNCGRVGGGNIVYIGTDSIRLISIEPVCPSLGNPDVSVDFLGGLSDIFLFIGFCEIKNIAGSIFLFRKGEDAGKVCLVNSKKSSLTKSSCIRTSSDFSGLEIVFDSFSEFVSSLEPVPIAGKGVSPEWH